MADARAKRFNVKQVLQLLDEESDPGHSSDENYDVSTQESSDGKHDHRKIPCIIIIIIFQVDCQGAWWSPKPVHTLFKYFVTDHLQDPQYAIKVKLYFSILNWVPVFSKMYFSVFFTMLYTISYGWVVCRNRSGRRIKFRS
jgi:hypothetical protein